MKKIMIGFMFFLVSTALGSLSYGLSTFEQIVAKAEQGSGKDQVLLGDAYANGRGMPQDYKMAFSWYQKAAEQGYALGQRPLGVLYELGRGVNKSGAKAAYWYEKAASQGVARAQVNLGILYETGLGVVKDYSTAFSWYKKAADQGYGRGLNKLALLYEKGWGVEADITRAIALYERGAVLKYSKAMLNLGRIYSKGVAGVPVDLKVAASWYQKAVNLGFIDALPDLQQIRAKISEVPAIVPVPESLEVPEIKKELTPKKETLEPETAIRPEKIAPRPQIVNQEVKAELSSSPAQTKLMPLRYKEAVPPAKSKEDELSLLVPLFVGSVATLAIVFLLGLLLLKKKKMAVAGSGSIIAELEGDIKKIRGDIEQLTQVYGQSS